MTSATNELDIIIDAAVEESAKPNAAESRSIMNPITGALVDMDDIDSVIRACVEAKEIRDDLTIFDDTVRRRAAEFAAGASGKTRRIQGKELRAKIEMPDETWDNSILKEAWNSYPDLRERYLRLSKVDVDKREFNKLRGMTTDDPKFAQFMGMLFAAEKPPTGAPRVSLEK